MTAERARMFWLVSLAALAIRAAHVVAMSDLDANPLFRFPIMDAGMHDMWARGLLAGTWPGQEPFFRAPFYIVMLAGLYALFGTERLLAVYMVHALISALGGGLVALIAARAWGGRAGWLAGLIYACLWTSIYFAAELLLETPLVTLLLLLIWLLLADDGPEGAAAPRGRRLLAAGLVWGLAAITRPTVLVLAPVFVWHLWRGRRLPLRSRAWLALALGLALPILPVTAHNVLRGHDAVLLATQGGVNFYIGNNPISDGRTAYVPGTRPTWQGGFDDVLELAQKETGRRLRPSEVDRYYLRKGLAFIAEQPLAALKLYAHKVRLLLAAGERSNNKNDYFWRQRSVVLRWPFWLGWAPVLFLAVIGWCRRDLAAPRRLLLLGVPVVYALSVLPFFVNGRFRLPILAMLACAAGGGTDRLLAAARARRWPDPRWSLALAAGLLAFAIVPDRLKFTESAIDRDPFSWHTLGNAYVAAGRPDSARLAYRRAVGINEQFPQRHFQWIEESLYTRLGDLLVRQGRTSEALQLYEGWVRFNPGSVPARVRYGEMLLQLGNADAAGAQFEMALRDDPDHGTAQLGQAWVMRARGDVGAALRRFRAVGEEALWVQAKFGEGLCLIDLDRLAEAEQVFLEIVRRQPDYWQAWGNLAGLYDRTGRSASARQTYLRVLELNPQDQQARRWLAANPPGR